jgi:hypothetical protein
MRNNRPDVEHETPPPRRPSVNLTPLFVFSGFVAAVFVAVGAGFPWLRAITPRWLVLDAAISFLWTLLGVYFLAVPAIVLGGCWSCLALVRARRRRDRAAVLRSFRWLLLTSTSLIALITMEVVSAIAIRWSYNIPWLPTRFATAAARSVPATDNGLYLVVVGESSARGEPYQPWVSVGQILGWQLEGIFPDRPITVDIRAKGGATLEQALPLLADLKRRPDAIILFSGHNEFQTRFGWSRNVRHYVEEGPNSPLALLELARSISSTATLILKTLDNYYGEAPPPPDVRRELVDHPICTTEEYAATRQDFERRLDAFVTYCGSIKALPILIVPGSNDGSFEPNRSVLAGSTPARDRLEFMNDFSRAQSAEAHPRPESAISAYRDLVVRHPEFAETHFRLARLLAKTQAWDEAKEHFVKARDLDGSPIRCPTDFRQTFKAVASHRDTVLIDGPALLADLSPHGILDDYLYHDAHHLSLIGTIALAQDILRQLRTRRAFGWPESAAVPRIDLVACVRHFQLDAEKCAKLCERCAEWYTNTSNLRFDPSERIEVSARYREAARAIAAGHPLPASVPGSLVPLVPMLETTGAELRRSSLGYSETVKK